MTKDASQRTRTWYLEIGGNPDHDEKLYYLVRMTDEEAFALSEELMALTKRGKIQTFKLDPADQVALSLAELRRRLGLGRT